MDRNVCKDLREYITYLNTKDFPSDLRLLQFYSFQMCRKLEDMVDTPICELKEYRKCPTAALEGARQEIYLQVSKICALILLGVYEKRQRRKAVSK